jgi:hypothetical protein
LETLPKFGRVSFSLRVRGLSEAALLSHKFMGLFPTGAGTE